MNPKKTNLQLIKNKDLLTISDINYDQMKKRDYIFLEDDFIPYIIPNIYIGQSYGNKLSFREGNDSFLNVV